MFIGRGRGRSHYSPPRGIGKHIGIWENIIKIKIIIIIATIIATTTSTTSTTATTIIIMKKTLTVESSLEFFRDLIRDTKLLPQSSRAQITTKQLLSVKIVIK